jgi:hypothetical protein
LNDDYDGGEIVIDRKKIKPTKGSVIILNQYISHECLKIKKNIKKIIRMDIMYDANDFIKLRACWQAARKL